AGALAAQALERVAGSISAAIFGAEEHDVADVNQSYLRRLLDAREEERERIARDIHDRLGQQITALRLNLDRLASLRATDDLDGAVSRMQQLCESLDRHIDFMVWRLRPSELDRLGLSGALAQLVRGFEDHSDVSAEYESSDLNSLRLPPAIESH